MYSVCDHILSIMNLCAIICNICVSMNASCTALCNYMESVSKVPNVEMIMIYIILYNVFS